MSRVESFSVPGVECWFYSNDHRPPHFHARRRGEWSVRVFFLEEEARMIEVIGDSSAGPSRRQARQLLSLAKAHRAALLGEWERKVLSK